MDYRNKFLSRKFIVPATLVIVGGILIPSHFASAGLIDLSGTTLNFIFGWLIDFLGWIFGATLLPLAGFLVNEAFELGGFINNDLVKAGWTISRDIANMFFILILIAIGFATTLRIEGYNVKKLLPRLIIIALLINFSLVIGGIFIDMGNSIGYYFTHTGIGDGTGVGDNVMAAVKLSKTFDVPTGIGDDGAGLAMLTKRIMSLVLIVITAFVLFAMALIMLFRMIYLWILLIISPLAWAAYILPGTNNMFKTWWKDFMRWAFFPAIYGFFIYLALLSSLGQNINLFASVSENTLPGGTQASFPFSNIQFLLQYIAVIFILVYGLILSNKWGLAGAGMATKWGKNIRGRAGKMVGGYAKRKGVGIAGNLSKRAMYGKDEEGKLVTRSLVKGMASGPLSKITGNALRPLSASIQARSDQIKKQEKQYTSMDPGLLKLRRGTLDADQKISADRALATKGQLSVSEGLISEGDIANSMKRATTLGLDKELIMAAPDIALKARVINDSEDETLDKIGKILDGIKPKDFSKLSKNSINYDDDKIDEGTKNARIKISQEITNRFKEGGNLHANHLASSANDNPGFHEALSKELKGIGESGLQKGVWDYLTNGPSAPASSEKAPSKSDESKDKGGDKGEATK